MDITQQLQTLKPGEIYLADGFTLYEAMSANELFDKKIDSKLGLAEADTPDKLIKSGQIKTASQLSQEELIGLFDLTIGKFMMWLNGHALAQTVYTLVYQYDDALWDQPLIKALFETLNSVGSVVYRIIKDAPFLKEEDYNPSIFSFRTKKLSVADLMTFLLNPLDSELQSKLKKSKKPTLLDGISARVKLLKGLTQLVSALNVPYSQESASNASQQIDFIRKRMDIIIETQKLGVDMDKYISDSMSKHIGSVISMRKSPKVGDTYNSINQMLIQLEEVLGLALERNFFNIQSKIGQIINGFPKNILCRAYLESNIFRFDNLQYFQSTPWIQIIINTLTLMYPSLNFDQLNDKEHKEFQDYLVPITYDYTIRQLRAKFRQMRDFNKLYQLISMLVHQCNTTDNLLFKSKNPLMIYSYEIALQMMITQLELGFELELYSEVDYSTVFYYLEYLTTILDKNRTNYVHQLPQQMQQLLNKDQKKRKVAPIVDQMCYEMPFWKGMNLIFKSYSRLYYILMEHDYIKKVPNLEQRYSNRLKMFENSFYVKPIKYAEYIQVVSKEGGLNETLTYVQQHLMEAQQQFTLLKDQKAISQLLQDQSKELIKVCVIGSVNCMKLRNNNQQKIKLTKTCVPYIQMFELQ